MKKDRFKSEPDGEIYGPPPVKRWGCVIAGVAVAGIAAGVLIPMGNSAVCVYGPPPIEKRHVKDSTDTIDSIMNKKSNDVETFRENNPQN